MTADAGPGGAGALPAPAPGALPPPPSPAGRYAPATRHRGLAFTAGMTPRRDGRLVVTGLVGGEVDVAAARDAAGIAAENALAAVAALVGGLPEVERVVRLGVFVACVDGFTEASAVADGASEALVRHLPGAGLPARTAVGVRALPAGAPVEVELVVAVRPGYRRRIARWRGGR